MQIERLEHRRLLSTTITEGVVTVTGDDARNVVHVSKTETELVVTEYTVPVVPPPPPPMPPPDGPTTQVLPRPGPRPLPPRPVPVVTRVPLADVKSVTVNAAGGNDYVSIARNVTAPATVNGGAGNDSIITGGGADTVNAGAGNDRVSGGAGGDTLNGDAGVDALHGDAGNDTVNGGDGGDYILGGSGLDVLNGQNGNDYIVSYDPAGERDTVDGGGNDPVVALAGVRAADVCIADAADAVTNCEVVRRPPPPPPPRPRPFPLPRPIYTGRPGLPTGGIGSIGRI